jgi:hypothetical protein
MAGFAYLHERGWHLDYRCYRTPKPTLVAEVISSSGFHNLGAAPGFLLRSFFTASPKHEGGLGRPAEVEDSDEGGVLIGFVLS